MGVLKDCDTGCAFQPDGNSRRNSPAALATLAFTDTCTFLGDDEGKIAVLSGRFTATAGTTTSGRSRSPKARSAYRYRTARTSSTGTPAIISFTRACNTAGDSGRPTNNGSSTV